MLILGYVSLDPAGLVWAPQGLKLEEEKTINQKKGEGVICAPSGKHGNAPILHLLQFLAHFHSLFE